MFFNKWSLNCSGTQYSYLKKGKIKQCCILPCKRRLPKLNTYVWTILKNYVEFWIQTGVNIKCSNGWSFLLANKYCCDPRGETAYLCYFNSFFNPSWKRSPTLQDFFFFNRHLKSEFYLHLKNQQHRTIPESQAYHNSSFSTCSASMLYYRWPFS